MPRRSPPSRIPLVPAHIPTPARGAQKFFLPSAPIPIPLAHRTCLRARAHSASDSTASSVVLVHSTSTFTPYTISRGRSASIASPAYALTTTVSDRVPSPQSGYPLSQHEHMREEDAKAVPPWVRSRGFEEAERRTAAGLQRPRDAVLIRR